MTTFCVFVFRGKSGNQGSPAHSASGQLLGLIALSYRDACEPGTNLIILNRGFAGSSPYGFWCCELTWLQLPPMGRLGRGAFSDHSFGDDESTRGDTLIPLGRLGSVPTPPCEPFFSLLFPGFIRIPRAAEKVRPEGHFSLQSDSCC